MKTREDVEALKNNWLADPCYDLASVEGFEEFHSELDAFQDEQEANWKQFRAERLNKRKQWIGDNDYASLAEDIFTPEEIESTLRSLDHQVGDGDSATDFANFKISQALVRSNILITIQLKRIGDLLEEAHSYDKYIRGS